MSVTDSKADKCRKVVCLFNMEKSYQVVARGMAKVYPLFSGSKGNCYCITSGERSILIDVGRSAKQIEASLKDNNIDPDSIEGIFITHEHTDHIKGVRVFASKYGIDVFATDGTLSEMENSQQLAPEKFRSRVIGDGAEVAGMTIRPFRTSHDCRESVGYTVETANSRKVALVTDTGCITEEIRQALTGCDVAVIESNHDVNMLLNGRYPYPLKRRILSQYGHISNDTCSALLPKLVKEGTSRIILAHLSKENNFPQLALQSARCTLGKESLKENVDYLLTVAHEVSNGSYVVF